MKLSDLAPNPANPRKIDDWHLDALKKSLEKFGDLSGIVYNKRTKRLVGGHQRIKVLPPDAEIEMTGEDRGHVKIGDNFYQYREVDWDELDEKAANIAANKQGGEWDLPLLNEWLMELDEANYPMELVGFDPVEIEDTIVPVEYVPEADEDEIPEKVEPKTKLGDLYKLGNHRLLCGDSTNIQHVERLMGGEKADMVFTDPPYGIDVQMNNSRGHNPLTTVKIIGDTNTEAAVGSFDICSAMNIPMIFWGANHYAFDARLPNSKCWIAWNKQEANNHIDQSDCEFAWTNINSPARQFHHLWAGFRRDSEKGDVRVHPTQKPIELVVEILDHFKKYSGKAILDLFLGSGSTLIACEKTNRKCYGMEIDPHYCDVIVARWEKYSGKKAELIESATN